MSSVEDFRNAIKNSNGTDLSELYEIADSIELNDDVIDFIFETIGSSNWHAALAAAQALSRAENRLDEIIPKLHQLLSHDKILLVTAAVKAFSNFGPAAESMLDDLFQLINSNKKEQRDDSGAYSNMLLVRHCVVAISNIGKSPNQSCEVLREIIDASSLPLKPTNEDIVHDPKDLRATACGALINFPSELDESVKVWKKGVVCYGEEKIRAACYIALVQTSFDKPDVRKTILDMIADLAYLKDGLSPEREAALYIERLSDFDDYHWEIVSRFLEPEALWATSEWNTSSPVLKYFVESDSFTVENTQSLIKSFSDKNPIVRFRCAMLLAHTSHCRDEVVEALKSNLEKQTEDVLDGIFYALEILGVDTIDVERVQLLGDENTQDSRSLKTRIFDKIKSFRQ